MKGHSVWYGTSANPLYFWFIRESEGAGIGSNMGPGKVEGVFSSQFSHKHSASNGNGDAVSPIPGESLPPYRKS